MDLTQFQISNTIKIGSKLIVDLNLSKKRGKKRWVGNNLVKILNAIPGYFVDFPRGISSAIYFIIDNHDALQFTLPSFGPVSDHFWTRNLMFGKINLDVISLNIFKAYQN